MAVAILAVVAGGGYWWVHRPPGRSKPIDVGLYPVAVNGKSGFKDRSGKIVITPQFDEVSGFSEGLAKVKIGSKVGFINAKGGVVVTPQFDDAYGFSEGLAAVQVGTKFGYINTKGQVVITPQFDDINSFHNGRAAVKLCCGRYWSGTDTKVGHASPNRYGFIGTDGKYVGTPGFLYVPFEFTAPETRNPTPVRTADDRIGIMDATGNVTVVDKADELGGQGFKDGLAAAASSGRWGYFDVKGQWAIPPQFEDAYGFTEGLATVTVGGRSGLIDRSGKFVVNPQFDFIFGVSEGYAIFETGKGTIPGCQYCSNYGFINLKGDIVIPAKFVQRMQANGALRSPVQPFSEGLAAVKMDDGWGFIDPTGTVVIAPMFEDAYSFADGVAWVRIAGKRVQVTKAGTLSGDPFPGMTLQQVHERAVSGAQFLGQWSADGTASGEVFTIAKPEGDGSRTFHVASNIRFDAGATTEWNAQLLDGELVGRPADDGTRRNTIVSLDDEMLKITNLFGNTKMLVKVR